MMIQKVFIAIITALGICLFGSFYYESFQMHNENIAQAKELVAEEQKNYHKIIVKGWVDRHVDEEFGIVCYRYFENGISCLELTRGQLKRG